MLPRVVSPSGYRLTDDDPWVVVAEDTGIFLVTRRIGGYLAVFYLVAGECWIVQDDTVLTVKVFLHRVKGLVHHSFLCADARHGAPALGFDENLPFFIRLRANGLAVIVICPQEPFAVPSVLLDSFTHSIYVLLRTLRFRGFRQPPA